MTTSTEQNPTFEFPDIGSYPVSFTVTLPNGQVASVVRRVNIFELINTSFSFDIGICGLEVTFTDTSSVTETIVSWLWDFDDGFTSTEQNPVHTYALDGTYNVSLTVETSAGGIGAVFDEVIVEEVVETVTADFSFIATGLSVDFTDESVTNTNIVSWAWDFGDGDTSTSQNPTHVYDTDGDYDVELVVTAECDSTSDDFTDTVSVEMFAEPMLGKGAEDAVVITNDARVAVTSNFISGSPPTWTLHDLSGSLSITRALIDPFSPYYLGTGSEVNAYVVGTSGGTSKFWKIEDLFSARTVTLLEDFGTSFNTVSGFDVSRTTPDVVALAISNETGGSPDTVETFIYYSTNGGSTWSNYQITTPIIITAPPITNNGQTFSDISLKSNNDIVVYNRDAIPDNAPSFVAKLSTGTLGGSLSSVGHTGASTGTGTQIYVPYEDSAIFTSNRVSVDGLVFKGSSDVSPLDSVDSQKMGTRTPTTVANTTLIHPIASYIDDDDIMYAIVWTDPSDAHTWAEEAVYSTDGGATWTMAQRFDSDGAPVTMNSCWIANDDPDTVFVVGNRYIGYSESLSSTLTSKAAGGLATREVLVIATK